MKSIIFNLFRRKKSDVPDSKIKKAFKSVKAEFGEHLESINQNTNEIQSNYEFLCELDAKISKLNEKIDEIQMFLYPEKIKKTKDDYNVSQLTRNEQEVFLVIYANEDTTLTFSDISHRTGLPNEIVESYVGNLVKKGVPISKKIVDNQMSLTLDPDFRDLQAKENIIKINESIAQQVVG